MGAAASANVRGRLEYIAFLEAEVQMLRAEKQDALRKVIVADSEKENIGHQSLRNRQTAGQAKANLVLATEQSAVNIAHLEAKVSEAMANEEHATLLLKELKADYELVKLELLASKIKADAEAKALLRIVNRLTAEKEYTVKTLVQKYDAIIEPLVRAPNPIREDFITFLGHIGELADGLKVKQIKSDILAEISSREAEAANYKRIPLSAYLLPAKEFLLQDPDWAAALADITRGVEPEHWKETVAKAQVFFRDKLPTDIFNDALKSIENTTQRLEGSAAHATQEIEQEVAEVTLTLNAAFDDIPEGSQQREDFKKNVLMDIAQSLGISVDCLEITDLLPGSIIVKFKIKGDKASLPAQPSALAANLLEQAQQADSALMTGLVTSSTKGLEAQTQSPSHMRAAAAAAMFASPVKVVVPDPRHMSPAALSPRSLLPHHSNSSNSSPVAAAAVSSAHASSPPAPADIAAASPNRADAAAEMLTLSLHDLHTDNTAAGSAPSSPHSAASSARSSSSAHEKAAARAEKARMYKLQRQQEEDALRLAGTSQKPASESSAPSVSSEQPEELGAKGAVATGNQYALPEDQRSLAVLDVLRRQKMADMTMAAFTGSNSEFFEKPVVDTVCEIHFKSDDAYDDSFEVGGSATKDYLYHPQVLLVVSYKDFVEERRDMRRYVWPDVTALVNDFGYAFRPVDPWIGCTSDVAAFSTDCMSNALDGTISAQFWLFLFGSTYGYVPPLNVMSACSKKFPWYDAFRSERAYHPSWHEVVWMRNIFPDIELVKRRVMHFFRDVNYGETFTPEIREHFRESVAERLELVQRLKDSVVETSLPLSTDYASPESGVRQVKDVVMRMMREFHKQESDQIVDNRRQMNAQMACMNSIASEWFGHSAVVQKLLDFIDTRNPTTVPLCVCAPVGGGKTSLIARFRRDFRSASSQAFFITYFVSATTESRNVDRMCMFIVRSLKQRFKFDDDLPDVLPGISDWCSVIRTWLGMAACKGRVVLLIDGVDQLDDRPGARSCSWLPRSFPLETRIILTCSPGTSLDVMQERSYDVFNYDIFADASGIKDTIKFHLQQRNRRLSEDIRLALGAKIQSIQASPFFLTVLLEEILMMQDQNRNPDLAISEYLACLQANTLESLLEFVTWKWEGIFDKYSQGTCRGILSLLAASRWGLSEWEMLECMPHISRVALLHFFNSTSYFWHWHNGYVNFKHGAMRIAVEARFMPTRQERQAVHVKLARYFGSLAVCRRRLEEQPWQLFKAEMWQELMHILSDMDMFKRLSKGVDMWRYDIRDFYHASNLHLDASVVLLRGVNKFRESAPPIDELIDTSRLVAEFLTRQNKISESIDIFHALLSQGQQKVADEIALIPSRFGIKVMDMAIYPKAEVGLQEQLRLEKVIIDVKESLSKLQGERWKQGVREFSVLNEGRDMMEDVVESRKKHVAAVTRIIEQRAIRQAESKMSESPMERLHREGLEKQLRDSRVDLNFSRGKLASLCVLQGDYSTSFELFDVAMQEFTSLFQSNHYSVSDMAAGLAELFLHRRDYSKAENFARKLVMIRHICYGWHHPEFAKGLELLSTILRSRGNEFDADVMMRRASSIMMAFGLDSSKKELEGARIMERGHLGHSH